MESLEAIRERILASLPEASLEVIPNRAPALPSSLLVDPAQAVRVARFLRDDPELRLDFCSNVTAVDWLDSEVKQRVKEVKVINGEEKEVEVTTSRRRAGYLEAVYHLYSVALGHGPLTLRQRTGNRIDRIKLASLTPVWRAAEFQEREAYDLFGILFEGHPDLRRILMWDEYRDHPMKKDFVEPDDYEYEPTPHDDVLSKARRHYPLPSKS